MSFAFFEFSDPFQKEKFQTANGIGPVMAFKLLMYAELFDRIATDELTAWGFRTKPNPSDGPVRIPGHCFEQRPNVANCDADVVDASGWRYERVRIAIATDLPTVAQIGDRPELMASKRGRTSTYDLARKTLTALQASDPRYIDQSAEKLLSVFNDKYLEIGQLDGIGLAPLSRRALHNHLQKFRQELAGSGNNETSI